MEERYELTELELNSIAYHDGLLAGARQGKLEGKLEALGELLLSILALRQLPVDGTTEARILGCKDPEQLQRWTTRAAQAGELADLFG